MFWRFYAILDSDVEYFISRDCDSRLNQKEVAAVDEWIKSGKILHTMHDNPDHAGAIILGGMWGCNNKINQIIDLRHEIEKWTTCFNKGDDQRFLMSKVWPKLSNNCIRHIGNCPWAKMNVFGPYNEFPIKGEFIYGTFIGEQIKVLNNESK
ncbi:MAG: hypothetical protein PHS54_00405 [Clostridia bacterium]|nr:hypothetical protein [Clostridia bacterium]